MQIREIRVSAGRTFNHPHESYSNLRCDLTLNAQLDEGDDPEAVQKALQAKVEGAIEDHKNSLLRSIEELREMTYQQQEAARLERSLRDAQQRLDEIRAQWGDKLPAALPVKPAVEAQTFDFMPSAEEHAEDSGWRDPDDDE